MNTKRLVSVEEALKEIEKHTDEEWWGNKLLSLFVSERIDLIGYVENITVLGHLTGANDESETMPEPSIIKNKYFYLSSASFESWDFGEQDNSLDEKPCRYTAKDCVKALINEDKTKRVLNRFTIIDGEGEIALDDYTLRIDKLFITKLELLLLIENIQLKNDNQYVWISSAASMMMQKTEGRKYKKLIDSFQFVTAPKYQERIINAVNQGFIPRWGKSINGHWESNRNANASGSTLVMLEDINQYFGFDGDLQLRVNNLLTVKIIKDSPEYKAIKGQAYKDGVISIFNFIVQKVSSYDFSEFNAKDINHKGVSSKRQIFNEVELRNAKLKRVTNLKTFDDYWNHAVRVLASVAKKEKAVRKKKKK